MYVINISLRLNNASVQGRNWGGFICGTVSTCTSITNESSLVNFSEQILTKKNPPSISHAFRSFQFLTLSFLKETTHLCYHMKFIRKCSDANESVYVRALQVAGYR